MQQSVANENPKRIKITNAVKIQKKKISHNKTKLKRNKWRHYGLNPYIIKKSKSEQFRDTMVVSFNGEIQKCFKVPRKTISDAMSNLLPLQYRLENLLVKLMTRIELLLDDDDRCPVSDAARSPNRWQKTIEDFPSLKSFPTPGLVLKLKERTEYFNELKFLKFRAYEYQPVTLKPVVSCVNETKAESEELCLPEPEVLDYEKAAITSYEHLESLIKSERSRAHQILNLLEQKMSAICAQNEKERNSNALKVSVMNESCLSTSITVETSFLKNALHNTPLEYLSERLSCAFEGGSLGTEKSKVIRKVKMYAAKKRQQKWLVHPKLFCLRQNQPVSVRKKQYIKQVTRLIYGQKNTWLRKERFIRSLNFSRLFGSHLKSIYDIVKSVETQKKENELRRREFDYASKMKKFHIELKLICHTNAATECKAEIISLTIKEEQNMLERQKAADLNFFSDYITHVNAKRELWTGLVFPHEHKCPKEFQEEVANGIADQNTSTKDLVGVAPKKTNFYLVVFQAVTKTLHNIVGKAKL